MKIYFMGICGTAMGNVAVMLKRANHEIIGADTGVYDPMKSVLEKESIKYYDSYDVERLKSLKPDLVVIGNAMSRGNPEVEYLLASRKINFMSLAELVGTKVIDKRKCLVVSGTHGKTSTSCMASVLLKSLYKDTGWLIGGVPRDLASGSNFGESNSPFVIEGDEYDTAFFDKRSKFIHYRPYVLLINNIEFDHGDIFRDLEDVKRTFTHVRRIVSGQGAIVENADDANIASLEIPKWVKRLTVGLNENAFLRIKNFTQNGETSSFELHCQGKMKKFSWELPALYNARNAAMAIMGCSVIAGLENPLDLDFSHLENFQGVQRRQEIICDTEKVVVVEDFGHHPTAIAGTIEALKLKYRTRKVIACFEPRSNTAKTNVFEKDFANALNNADKIYLGAIFNVEKIEESKRLNPLRMKEICKDKLQYFDSNEDLLNALLKNTKDSEENLCVIFFSNGSFDRIHKRYAEECSKA